MIKKRLKILFLILVIVVTGLYFFVLRPRLPILNGYAAKCVCSASFIADRDLQSIESQDLGFFPVSLAKNKIDLESKTVTSSFLGLSPRKAIYLKSYGCTLLAQGQKASEIAPPSNLISKGSDALYWPLGEELKDTIYPEIDNAALETAVQNALGPIENPEILGTRAVVVVYKNNLIFEKYAAGFNADTEILGWSMTKSIINALTGILVKEGKLSIAQKTLFDEWENDDRKNISLDNLLQMSSGLDWDESYGSKSDVTQMLYEAKDVPDMANDPAMIYTPGKKWYYSSGTTNLISGIIRQQFESFDEYLQFPKEALFNKINMSSAIMELDPSGNFIGSSYCFATPRDWAKFGLLYLNNGNWYGEQILSEEWIQYTRKTIPESKGEYGAHFWHNENGIAYPDAPFDLYSANGFQGQRTFIIPSKDLVIVRMGMTDSSEFDFNNFLKEITESIH